MAERIMKYMTLASESSTLSLLVCCSSNYIELDGNHLASGVPYKGEYINIKVNYGEPYYADIILSEPCLSPVVSPKLAFAIKEKDLHYGEMIPIVDGFYKDYFVLNPLPLLDLVDEKNSTNFFIVTGHKIYSTVQLKEYSGSQGFFRITNFNAFPFVTDDVIRFIKQFDYKGIAFSDDLINPRFLSTI